MASTRFTRTRARIGYLSQTLPPDDPQLATLREELKSAVIVQRISAVLAKSIDGLDDWDDLKSTLFACSNSD